MPSSPCEAGEGRLADSPLWTPCLSGRFTLVVLLAKCVSVKELDGAEDGGPRCGDPGSLDFSREVERARVWYETEARDGWFPTHSDLVRRRTGPLSSRNTGHRTDTRPQRQRLCWIPRAPRASGPQHRLGLQDGPAGPVGSGPGSAGSEPDTILRGSAGHFCGLRLLRQDLCDL